MNHIKNVLGFIAVFGLLAVASPVGAHSDPGACSSNGVGLSVTVYRANGTTLVVASGDGTVQSGETIKYGATLSHLGGSNCNFEAGTLTITTPDGVPHVVASGIGIPLVTSGSPFIAPQQSYVVSESNLSGGDLDASVTYAGGTSHLGVNEQTAGANVNISSNYTDVSLTVSKTANPASTLEYNWTIDKSVTPATWDLFNGDSGTSEYTIALNKSAGATSYSVTGTITIHNPALFASATVSSVSDVLGIDGSATVVCPGSAPYIIPSGGDLICTYSKTLAGNTTQTNTATAVTTGDVGGGSGNASVDFSNVSPVVTNGTVSVDDTFALGDAGPFSASTSYNYSRTFTCGAGQTGTGNNVHNIATIEGTQTSDFADVTINCYGLDVSKTANTTFNRTYNWDVTKSVNDTEITLAEGEPWQATYTITATKTSQTDSNWAVSGNITIANNHPSKVADLTGVADSLSIDLGATVVCPGTTVPAGGNIVCTYSKTLTSGAPQTNTATATQQNYSYDKNGVATPTGTTPKSGNANVTFSGTPTNTIDEEVTVTDPLGGGTLGTVTVAESPKVFNYNYNIVYTGEDACGDHTVDNTATITTNDTRTVDTASASVLVHVNCPQGCTLTQGYWKTHNDSFKGGAPTDLNWNSISVLAEKTLFFSPTPNDPGTSWFNVFWTAPKGNVYYNLAHQYMAAVLNKNNGASVPANVQTAIDSAATLFTTKTPTQAGALKGAAKNAWTTLAGTLGSYNEGTIGPGHCDEQNPS